MHIPSIFRIHAIHFPSPTSEHLTLTKYFPVDSPVVLSNISLVTRAALQIKGDVKTEISLLHLECLK